MLEILKTRSLEELQSYFKQQLAQQENPPGKQLTLRGTCYVCGAASIFRIEPAHHSVNWRETLACETCWLINRWRSCFHLFEQICSPAAQDTVYLTEAVTPLFKLIKSRYPNTHGSEFHPKRKRGARFFTRGRRVQMQDVTALTFDDVSFESVLSFDVLEHVPDFNTALGEFHRVLKPGGKFLLSVPFTFHHQTEIRAELKPDGTVTHLQPPQYHEDPLSRRGVLCYQVFGMDILEHMASAGFENGYVCGYTSTHWGYLGPNILIVGEKSASPG